MGFQRRKDVPPQMRREPGSHLAGESQCLALIDADEQRIDALRTGPVTADEELLLPIQFQLEPCIRPLTGVVLRVLALGDDAFEPQATHGAGDLRDRAGEIL
jgi:hypothetical protein